jgi:hypothetical protein
MTISSPLFPAGYTCTGPAVASLVVGLQTKQNVSVVCDGGLTWNVDLLPGGASGMELSVGPANSCSAVAAVRPCLITTNWGGVNGSTCNAASQTITVTVR